MAAMWWATALVLCLVGAASAAPREYRLQRFGELGRGYAEAPDADAADRRLSELLELVDAEVLDNLRSPGPFASVAFVQERLDAFGEAWGGASFRIVRPERATRDPLMLVLGTVSRGEAKGVLRAYGGARGEMSLLASSIHDGVPEFHAWPARAGASQFFVAWLGAPTGRGSWPLYAELWRDRGDRAARIWTSDDAFPEGVLAQSIMVSGSAVVVRYEAHYPGWQPGCEGQTEQEDVYRQSRGGDALVLARRRAWDGWHRELHGVVIRLFRALDAGDERTLAALVPDRSLRARLPRALRPDAACDQRQPGTPETIVVAATAGQPPRLTPWSLAWRRGPTGWRLDGASPVLQ